MKSNLDHQRLEIGLQREIEESVAGISIRTDFTTQTPPDSGETITNQGINYIDNSDKDFSKDAYVNATPAGGDVADECYNFYRQRFIRITDGELTAASTDLDSASAPFKSTYTYPMPFFALKAGTDEKALVGTITRSSDSRAVMSVASEADLTNAIVFFGEAYAETSANALKSSGHSLFAAELANESIARWDESAGQSEIGGDGIDNFDLSVPLPFNLATRGLDLFFSVNVKLRDGTAADAPVVLAVGIYDTTAGNEKFLEAENFDLTVNYIGAAGTEEYEMIVIGTFSSGEQVASDVVTVSNVASALDADNYLDWDWSNAPRVLDFALYRRDTNTGDVVRVFTIYNGETRFFDKNTEGEESGVSFPTAPARREYAYAESLPFVPTSEFKRIPIFFRVPPTYEQAATTSRQILRIILYNDAANDARPVILDRVMLSLVESVWNRSARDLERIASTAPTASTPDGNQGVGQCFVGDTPIVVKDLPTDEWRAERIENARRGMFISDGNKTDRVIDVRIGTTKETFEIELSNGISFECTASERVITSPADRAGTRIDRLNLGDSILTNIGGVSFPSKIIRMDAKRYDGAIKIYTLSLESGKIFLSGHYNPRWWKNPVNWLMNLIKPQIAGAKAHNRKSQDYIILE